MQSPESELRIPACQGVARHRGATTGKNEGRSSEAFDHLRTSPFVTCTYTAFLWRSSATVQCQKPLVHVIVQYTLRSRMSIFAGEQFGQLFFWRSWLLCGGLTLTALRGKACAEAAEP